MPTARPTDVLLGPMPCSPSAATSTAMLIASGHKVRALVRRKDERADALRRLGAEVMQGHLTDLASMHRAIEG